MRQAIALLRETQADSVVSVVELPKTHSPEFVCHIWTDGRLEPAVDTMLWAERPTRRQDVDSAYRPDGTVYAFWRRTVSEHGNIYGLHVRPLIIPPEQTCELDTMADWEALEARLKP